MSGTGSDSLQRLLAPKAPKPILHAWALGIGMKLRYPRSHQNFAPSHRTNTWQYRKTALSRAAWLPWGECGLFFFLFFFSHPPRPPSHLSALPENPCFHRPSFQASVRRPVIIPPVCAYEPDLRVYIVLTRYCYDVVASPINMYEARDTMLSFRR